jgi:predicted nucleic acid-binding protein
MKTLLALAACVGLALPAADAPAKPAAPAKAAKVVVTADLVCMHCDFGEGDACAPALKLDDKTPLLVEGQAAKELFPLRLKKKVVVAEGTLRLKDKQMVLIADKARVLEPADLEKEKGRIPAKGMAVVEGEAICGRCDLAVCDECTLAVKNSAHAIILDGQLAADHAEGLGVIKVTGRLFVDPRGLLRIEATKVDKQKK